VYGVGSGHFEDKGNSFVVIVKVADNGCGWRSSSGCSFPVPLQSPPQPAGLYPLSALATKGHARRPLL